MQKTFAYSLVLIAVAGAAYLTGSWRAPHETVTAAAADAPRAILHYRCSMHPDVKSDHPGTAPCCGMAFEPVYASAAAASATHAAGPAGGVVATSTQQQLIGIRTATVGRAGGNDRIRAFGRVVADETRLFRITGALEAYISEASGVTTGSSVKKGHWLASYATPDARTPVAAYVTAVNVMEREENTGAPTPAQLAAARGSLTLATERLMTMGMAPSQMDEIRRTRTLTTTVRLASPVDGVVLARNVATGQRFDAGAELFQIADLHRVWVLADVPVADGDRITPGTAAMITIAGRQTPVRARVSRRVLPQFDPATQTFKLRLEADNPGFMLRPDMFVDVDFEVSYEPAVLVPADAVVLAGLSAHVFVERSAGVFEPRDVQAGRRHGDRIAILRGLAPGDRIAVAGTFLLDSETRMKAHDRPNH
jgi:membrane fusion protein, copper/silver efflux system